MCPVGGSLFQTSMLFDTLLKFFHSEICQSGLFDLCKLVDTIFLKKAPTTMNCVESDWANMELIGGKYFVGEFE